MASKRIFTSPRNMAALASGISIPASMHDVLPRAGDLCGGFNLSRLCPAPHVAAALIATSKLPK